MDAAKILQELADGEFGDHIREKFVEEIAAELASDRYDDDREWADGVADWLRDQWL